MGSKGHAHVAPLTLADRPLDTLGAEPVIENEADVERALREFGFLIHHELAVAARLRARMDAAKAELVREMVVKIGRTTCDYPTRVKALETALEAYCETHPEMFPQGRKSRVFAHGTVGYRATPARVTYAEEKSAKTVVEAAQKAVKLLALAATWLSGVILRGRGKNTVHADLLFDVELKPNLTKASEAYKAFKLSDEDLAAFGLCHRASREKFYVTPGEYRVVRQAAG